jgi:hypothetical protein
LSCCKLPRKGAIIVLQSTGVRAERYAGSDLKSSRSQKQNRKRRRKLLRDIQIEQIITSRSQRCKIKSTKKEKAKSKHKAKTPPMRPSNVVGCSSRIHSYQLKHEGETKRQ